MDLHDFSGEAMYFDEPPPAEVAALIARAAEHVRAAAPDDASERAPERGPDQSPVQADPAEHALLRAYLLAPEDLSVLVALYRFYYYRHRLTDALLIADRAVAVAGRRLGLAADWRVLTAEETAQAAARSMTLTRFLLLALKGAGYLLLRQGDPAGALERLTVVARCDSAGRLNVTELLAWARDAVARQAVAAHAGKVAFIR